jgi:hypothetical protein
MEEETSAWQIIWTNYMYREFILVSINYIVIGDFACLLFFILT